MLTEKQTLLKQELYSVYDDRAFVMAIGTRMKNDEEVQMMLDFIKSDKWKKPYELTVKALMIEYNR